MAENSERSRPRRKRMEGTVVSDKMDKTRVVDVVRRFRHPAYEKVVTRHTRLYAHDEKNETHRGDVVQVMETRPLSRMKRWRIVRVMTKASSVGE